MRGASQFVCNLEGSKVQEKNTSPRAQRLCLWGTLASSRVRNSIEKRGAMRLTDFSIGLGVIRSAIYPLESISAALALEKPRSFLCRS